MTMYEYGDRFGHTAQIYVKSRSCIVVGNIVFIVAKYRIVTNEGRLYCERKEELI